MAKFRLSVNVEIQQCDDDGYPLSGNGRLSIREEIALTADSFLGIAKVLGQFHDLSEKIKVS